MLAPPPFKLEHFPRVLAHFRRSGKEKCHAAVAIGLCIPRVEPDGLVVVSNGLVVILLGAPGSAAALVGDARGARIEPDGLVIVSDGGAKLFSLQPDVGSPDIFCPIARVCADLAR